MTEPKSSQIKALVCTFFHDIAEIMAATVHQLDVPPPDGLTGSTRDSAASLRSTSIQMPTIEPTPQAHRVRNSPVFDAKLR